MAALVTTVLLVIGLRRAGADPRRAVLWALVPDGGGQAGGNAHIDVVAAGLVVAALLFLAGGTRAGTTVGGVLIGLAIAVKVTPVLLVPAVVRRRPVTVAVLAVLGRAGVVYLPHLWAVGGGVGSATCPGPPRGTRGSPMCGRRALSEPGLGCRPGGARAGGGGRIGRGRAGRRREPMARPTRGGTTEGRR